jgi:hypothetical protein
MSDKKSGNPFGIILVLAVIGGAAYFGYTRPEYLSAITAFFKGSAETAAASFAPEPSLGTEEHPFDWSSWNKQIASAPSLPDEGAQIYVKTASGNVRLAKTGEIKAAKDAYAKSNSAQPKPAASSGVAASPPPKKPDTSPQTPVRLTPSNTVTSEPATSTIPIPAGYIPKYALEEAEQHRTDFLREHSESASELTYRFFYNEEGKACLEYTVTPKGRYTWSTPVWIGYTWGNSSGSIGNDEIRYTITKKKKDEAQYRIEERRKDPVFKEIEKVVLQIATEYDYDYYGAYRKTVKYRDPNVKKAVCDGYADATVRALRNHPLVSTVEKWTSSIGGHAWNVIVLKDGRRLYCDATWYDSNGVDDEGYVIHIPAQNPVDLTFDKNEFNTGGGAINTATGKLLAVHFAWNDAKMQ